MIRNVTILDPNDEAEDKVVNILLHDRKLDIVTQDKISREDADTVINAKNGFLLGELEIGGNPSFIIFTEDPRKNFAVLMDTFSHSILIVHEGVIIKNRIVATIDEPEEEPTKAGWLAYTPPPFMIPLNYHSKDKWNNFETTTIDGVFVAALMLDRMDWLILVLE